MKKTAVILVVNSLESDGAQRQLMEMIKYGKLTYFVLPILWRGSLLNSFRQLENVELLGLLSFRRLLSVLYSKQTIVCGWMYHANFVAWLIAFVFRKNLIIAIHHDFNSLSHKPLKFKISFQLNKMISKYAKAVQYPSNKARDSHISAGFSKKNAYVLPNSLSERFMQLPECFSVSVPKDENLKLLFIGRNHPDKGTALFFDVFERLIATKLNVSATVVGSGHHPELLAKRHLSAANQATFLGHAEIDCAFLRTFDLLLVTSPAEAFSLVLLEAAACGLKFVSTDVGIARDLANLNMGWIGSTDVEVFSNQVLKALEEIRAGENCTRDEKIRDIREKYDVKIIARAFEHRLIVINETHLAK